MEFDYKTLLLLRENTWLDPISYLKVYLERQDAIEYQFMINKIENCQLGVDYTKANQLEAQLRFMKWKKDIIGYWIEHTNCATDLDEFALDVLYQQESKKKKLSLIK